jgi:hypothetical protein
MLSVEIRVNSQLISHIYVRNIGPNPGRHDYAYEYRYYEPESGRVVEDTVVHARDAGAGALVQKVLKAVG